jgi:NAD(P)-dependent dehydrogenase (short-subunit alcohol dehydrogenase family)
MSYFKDKVALVTGASRGVGLAMARSLCADGAKVVITARGKERLEAERKKLAEIGEVVSVCGDVGKWPDAQKMVDAALNNFGHLDILVNNAGVSMRGSFSDLSPEVCKQVIDTNLMGCVYMTRAAVDHIVKAEGHVVFISSIAGIFGVPGASLYCASKGALTQFSESLRLELKPRGVHLGVVYLGFTEHDPEKRILSADGTPILPDRPAHHTQAQAAGLILKMIEKRKKRLVMTPVGKFSQLAHRLSPDFVEQAILWAQSRGIGAFKEFS